MTKLNQILFNLELYTKDFEINVDIVRLMLEDSPVLTDLERLRWVGDPPSLTNTEITLLTSEDGKDAKLEFLGFCPWKLIETQGGLIPGNPTMGVFMYREKNYCFCCFEGFRSFEANPEQ
ncbi:PREDICTED: UPF0704 protein C6orf165 homolog [Nicrophorus vespilloides]|uniref:UPF0704 protein C6orf165 homolog n=1 Tax=Nicrophorus vespilloides TaxID=110193 RepID=A0ABM1M5U5_NICVS|nr:PREDICTED: UPF0704 protein C6orf165 homolog [Nicrophorus vespilloides]